MKITIDESLLHDITQIETVNEEDEANDLLKNGWVLLSVGKGQNQSQEEHFSPYFVYCLGKLKPKK